MIACRTKSVDDTKAMAAAIAPLVQPADLLVLAGDLGAGKTAFTQGLARGLGVTDPVTSPAFVLVRSYAGRLPLVHVDVYRLDHMQELVELGVPELLDEGGVTVVEWGDVVTPALPPEYLEVRLDHGDNDDERRIQLTAVGAVWSPRLAALGQVLGPWTVEQ